MQRKAQKLAERYDRVLPHEWKEGLPEELPHFFFVSGYSHPKLPLITEKGIRLFEWGLIPHWVKDAKQAAEIRSKTLNAVGETVFEKPSYRKSILSRRAILPLSGFFDWREFNGKKYPYFIKPKEDDFFSVGCIYDEWVDKESGEVKSSFSMITTPANPLMEKIHNVKKRMPFLLPMEDEKKWLDEHLSKEEIEALLHPYDETKMRAYTISRNANNARFDRNVPEILVEIKYDELPVV